MKTYRYSQDPAVALVFDEDGKCRLSMLASAVPEGVAIEPADPPPAPTPDQEHEGEALQDQRLRAMALMTVAQRRAWITANVTNLGQAREVIATLSHGLTVVLRQLFRSKL